MHIAIHLIMCIRLTVHIFFDILIKSACFPTVGCDRVLEFLKTTSVLTCISFTRIGNVGIEIRRGALYFASRVPVHVPKSQPTSRRIRVQHMATLIKSQISKRRGRAKWDSTCRPFRFLICTSFAPFRQGYTIIPIPRSRVPWLISLFQLGH